MTWPMRFYRFLSLFFSILWRQWENPGSIPEPYRIKGKATFEGGPECDCYEDEYDEEKEEKEDG